MDDVILSEAKDLLYSRAIENKSRFFSPPAAGGLQNDTPREFLNNLLEAVA